MNLSSNFTLDELIKSQVATRKNINNNPSPQQIENLKLLCENILQPIRDKFGRVSVSSGFRSPELCIAIGSSINSQHCADNVSSACDFEVYGVDNKEVADWIFDNTKVDQLILEFYKGKDEPNSGWIHASYVKENPRHQYLIAYQNEDGKVSYKPNLKN
jgi:zinc D-Ala-D-Ala carboxypeptidase